MRINDNPSKEGWDNFLSQINFPHIYQSWEWGELERELRANVPTRLLVEIEQKPVASFSYLTHTGLFTKTITNGGAGSGGGDIYYLPKLTVNEVAAVRLMIGRYVCEQWKKERIQSMVFYGKVLPEVDYISKNYSCTAKNTPIIALPKDIDSYMNEMLKKDTRYEIKKSAKLGVQIRVIDENDLRVYHALQSDFMQEKKLPQRLQNSFNDLSHAWDVLTPKKMLRVYFATHQGEIVGAVLTYRYQKQMFYRTGMVIRLGRKISASYALQYRVINDAITEGIERYNLMGATVDKITDFKLQWGATLSSYMRESVINDTILTKIGAKAEKCFGLTATRPVLFP